MMIRLKNVSKFYQHKNTVSSGFNKINLELDMGEFVVITGESGSGKSTLLNVISGLDSYEEGEMYINGEETSHYTETDYERYRRKYIGNIFQHFNLVNSYTVYQNIELVLLLNGFNKKDVHEKILQIIDQVDLKKYTNSKVSKLSGGQKQRVAIARALAKDTPIIVADEPTGNLDIKSAKAIMKLLKDISSNKLVVIVTHNYDQVENYATRKISMSDGRIIEDKQIIKPKEIKIETVNYQDLTIPNKFRIAFRNVFNIKTKFVLLFLVYFFLTLLVFSTYSSLESQKFNETTTGHNIYFQDTSKERVILNKKDKSTFTDEEIETLSNLENITKVIKDDLLLDLEGNLYDNDINFYGKIKSTKELTEVDEGELPSSPKEVAVELNNNSFYLSFYDGKLLERKMKFQNPYTGETIDNCILKGLKYKDASNFDGEIFTLYLPDEIIEKLKIGLNKRYSETELKINNKIYSNKDMTLYYEIEANKKVPDGQVYTSDNLNSYCSYYSCLYKKINLTVKNIYYEDTSKFKVTKILNKNNFKNATGLSNFENNAHKLFISMNDYNKLFNHGTFQVSVFLKDLHKDTETIQMLNSKGYDTFYMKTALKNEGELLGIMRIIRTVMFIIAIIALFFICFFIIKIILKSRNIYYSTIRILGSTKKVASELLVIELLADVNIAYIIFLSLIALTNINLIKIDYINNLITYLSTKDYLIIYIILSLMSLLIGVRYAHKLFKDSVMSTYREEV